MRAPSRLPFVLAALVAAPALGGCPDPARRSTPPPADLGYVEWIAQRPWALGDLPAVAASFDQLCLRAGDGDARAAELVAATAPALWLTRTMLLPLLRVLPGDEAVPAEAEVSGACPVPPLPRIETAMRELVEPALRDHAVELLLAGETQGAADGTADEVRLARVGLAVTLLLPLDGLAADTPALADAVAVLDPDHELLVLPAAAGGPCADDTAAPACLWQRLAAQGLMDANGAEALEPAALDPAALDALARHGLLNLAARNVLPLAEDSASSLRLLAAELIARLAAALQVEPEAAHDEPAEGDWPEAAP